MSKIRNAVEQFHLLFCGQLALKLDQSLYALKGGCNLRFFFNSIRYSEDIDFDVQAIAKDTLMKKVDKLLASVPFASVLKPKGIQIESFSAPKQTQTTQRWKVLLSVEGESLPVNTKLEFSRRASLSGVKVQPVQTHMTRLYQLAPVFVPHYDVHKAFEQKVHALIARTETQARDVFDLFLLLQQGAGDQLDKTKWDLAKARDHAMNIGFDIFNSQVVSYLEGEYQAQYGQAGIWDQIVLNVVDALEVKA